MFSYNLFLFLFIFHIDYTELVINIFIALLSTYVFYFTIGTLVHEIGHVIALYLTKGYLQVTDKSFKCKLNINVYIRMLYLKQPGWTCSNLYEFLEKRTAKDNGLLIRFNAFLGPFVELSFYVLTVISIYFMLKHHIVNNWLMFVPPFVSFFLSFTLKILNIDEEPSDIYIFRHPDKFSAKNDTIRCPINIRLFHIRLL